MPHAQSSSDPSGGRSVDRCMTRIARRRLELRHEGKHHRGVIFNGEDLPKHAIFSLDVGSAIELRRGLETTCTGHCDFLTIPHDMNEG